MTKKLIITESQFTNLKSYLKESEMYSSVVKQIKDELDANYTTTQSYVRKGGDYITQTMIKVNVDDEIISPKSLYEYLKFKYKMGDEFTKQVIKDWVNGKITDNFTLSKNVPIK